MYYFYIKDNKIIGCGQGKLMNKDIISVEVSEDMVNFDDDHTWESDRFKWKYKYDGEKIIENPDFEQEEIIHHDAAMKQLRLEAYTGITDPITVHIFRLRDTNPMTEEVQEKINQLIIERDNKIEEIKQKYPYINEE